MKTTTGMNLKMTNHAIKQAVQKGFTAEVIQATFDNPMQVYPSKSHPGQYRITGNGVCLVGVPEGNKFTAITLYADRVLTPPRTDQMKTAEGRRYAERYANGKGRG